MRSGGGSVACRMDWTGATAPLRSLKGRDLHIGPPCFLVAVGMYISVVSAAEWHRELIADSAAEGSRLRELYVVRITR